MVDLVRDAVETATVTEEDVEPVSAELKVAVLIILSPVTGVFAMERPGKKRLASRVRVVRALNRARRPVPATAPCRRADAGTRLLRQGSSFTAGMSRKALIIAVFKFLLRVDYQLVEHKYAPQRD